MRNAPLGRRILAGGIDYGTQWVLFMVYVHYAGEPVDDGYAVHGVAALLPVLWWFVYFVVCEAWFAATLGHLALGLRVVRLSGRSIHFTEALKRHLADPVDFFLFGLPAIITIKNTTHRQRIGDIWAHTRVVTTAEEPAETGPAEV